MPGWRPGRFGLAVLLASGIAGCSGTAILSEFAPGAPIEAAKPIVAPKMHVSKPIAIIGLNRVNGPPPHVAAQVVRGLNDAADRENIAFVVDARVATTASLTGFMLAQSGAEGSRLTFVWDIIGSDGARIDRITGEEVFPPSSGGDVWDAIPPTALQSMTEKVVASVGTAVPR